jgi:hypothetical protein
MVRCRICTIPRTMTLEMQFERKAETHVKENNSQRTYDVTSRNSRLIIVAVEKQWVLHILSVCVCSLSYPSCKGRAPYYMVICDLSGLLYSDKS